MSVTKNQTIALKSFNNETKQSKLQGVHLSQQCRVAVNFL